MTDSAVADRLTYALRDMTEWADVDADGLETAGQ